MFPDGKDAAAQGGIHRGYTYTQRICQEWGQQPRWYNVRDPIPGSDWSSSGGWAIILARGGATTTVLQVYGNRSFTGVLPVIDRDLVIRNAQGARAAYVMLNLPARAAIDQNGDGVINNDDRVDANNDGIIDPLWAYRSYREVTVVSTGRYIRWADMRYCR